MARADQGSAYVLYRRRLGVVFKLKMWLLIKTRVRYIYSATGHDDLILNCRTIRGPETPHKPRIWIAQVAISLRPEQYSNCPIVSQNGS